MNKDNNGPQANNNEVKPPPINNEFYNDYGEKWYTANDDPVALLRAESKAMFPWVLENIQDHFPLGDIEILDLGCGAGFLSNSLALRDYKVTGIDLSPQSLDVAAKHDSTKSVTYKVADAYQLPFSNESFEVVTAMDFLEHVEHPEKVIAEISRVLKPGGIFIFHTFNRNPMSNLIAIKLVEKLIKKTPKHMHNVKLFITPDEMEDYCVKNRMTMEHMIGIRPVFSSIPFKNYVQGIVPEKIQFKLTHSIMLSYLGVAIKQRSH